MTTQTEDTRRILDMLSQGKITVEGSTEKSENSEAKKEEK